MIMTCLEGNTFNHISSFKMYENYFLVLIDLAYNDIFIFI